MRQCDVGCDKVVCRGLGQPRGEVFNPAKNSVGKVPQERWYDAKCWKLIKLLSLVRLRCIEKVVSG